VGNGLADVGHMTRKVLIVGRPVVTLRTRPGPGRGSEKAPSSSRSKASRVLIVEHEDPGHGLAVECLARAGFDVLEWADGPSALVALGQEGVSMVIVDLDLPGLSGFDLLSQLRRLTDVPIVVLGGGAQELDPALCLTGGADDYLAKPFSPPELVARVEALLRRTNGHRAGQVLELGVLVVDRRSREVRVGDRVVPLTAIEFDLLAHLAACPRRVFSRAELLAEVWHSSAEWQRETTVTEHVRRLRQKIERDSDNPRWIRTVRGVGYRFDS
jgi:two-component system phosphate regulon response regulator PhoB